MSRCSWAESSPLMQAYHDHEWGRVVTDDQRLFEFLVLEMMQAGLSWSIVLNKRASLAEAFAQFDYQKIAQFTEEKVATLVQNPKIIRHRLKLQAVIHNAQCFMAIQQEFGSFARYLWQFTDGKIIHHHWTSLEQVPTQDKYAQIISKDLKKRGFKFVGPVTIYSYMQAIGMVNDHLTSCDCYGELVQQTQVDL
ncbi:DNA-3-methyladenine glycosylase I [Enterococcus columbae]|uniref:DNA-3-methyladenine glycosylase I n=1 Tax=Enterococcus columbae DSM 7374 = ATCC 51263 TaxID=1121865 RepID=S1N423_9ENTE|nr:DNA-3-methyladenine glycosylase I [Enterococcus columbae]EOT40562.1 hypothetical protein OMW_01424 [Enterococcus columbae DSM 7374 = ATCC 51263]EOW80338.1 hypothetical protein I568_02038 [Enterococcus columbae DSM 7374 = ATCC 51263]OJG25503.1 hypothetical protein RR47_GL001552 [Enterococcus columbae DSM 7374 = ATCC 51263]